MNSSEDVERDRDRRARRQTVIPWPVPGSKVDYLQGPERQARYQPEYCDEEFIWMRPARLA
jgi:hypothetical protein